MGTESFLLTLIVVNLRAYPTAFRAVFAAKGGGITENTIN